MRTAVKVVLISASSLLLLLAIGIVSILLLFKAAGLSLSDFDSPSDQEIQYTQDQGDQILSAIRTYITETGNPPSELDDLVPQHIATIPFATESGDVWEYHYTPEKDKFQLAFDWGEWAPVTWSNGGVWYLDTK